MIKNNYSLPLISDIVENIGTKKVFTKMDLWWGYNNVWIKEEGKWKMAFTMLEGLFDSDVFWTYQFTGNVSDYDEQNPAGSHQHWQGSKFYW